MTDSQSPSSPKIFIKSARRPWALDRLLTSIWENVDGIKAEDVVVMDDRTESIYLEELKNRHPGIRIEDLSRASPKSKWFRKEPLYISGWRQTIQRDAGEFFMLIEDDCWVTSKLPLDQIIESMGSQRLDTVSLLDQHLEKYIPVQDPSPGSLQRVTTPAATQSRSSVLRRFAYMAFLSRSPFGRALGLFLVTTKLLEGFEWTNAAVANTISGSVFRTSWWLKLWGDFQHRVDDNVQNRIAHRVLLEHPQVESPLALAGKMVVRTSYRTSVSASHKGINFEIANRVLSNHWLTGDIEVDETGDWSVSQIVNILEADSESKPFANRYEDWCEEFYKIHN